VGVGIYICTYTWGDVCGCVRGGMCVCACVRAREHVEYHLKCVCV